MKRMMLCLCMVLTLAVSCAAQNAFGPFTDVRLGTWPYAAVETLQKAEIPIGYPDGTYGGRRVMTRYEFAVGILRVYAQIPEGNTDLPQTEVGERLQQSLLAVNALLALHREFSPETDRLHKEVPKAGRASLVNGQNFLKSLREKQRRDISEGKIVLTPDELKSPFAELSSHDPAWYAADVLQKEGIIFGSLEDLNGAYTGGRILMTRLQTAKAIARLLSQLPHSLDLTNRLLQTSHEIPALRTLVTEFSPELKLLGNNCDSDLAQLTELEKSRLISPAPKPFADVPPSHWAAASVESLRLHGIVRGYRDGNFSVSP